LIVLSHPDFHYFFDGLAVTVDTTWPECDVCASDQVAQVAVLLFGDLDAPVSIPTGEKKTAGIQLVALLREFVYSSGPAERFPNRFVSRCVVPGTLAQAKLYCELLQAAMTSMITPHNCFSVMRLASEVGKGCCSRVILHARKCALNHFEEATREDADGWNALPEDVVVDLLVSDSLVISTELEVFESLATWVLADLQQRQSCFGALFSRCIRFARLSLSELAYLNDHELLIALDSHSVKMAAAAYILYTMGEVPAKLCGRTINTRPRKCQLANDDDVCKKVVTLDTGAASCVRQALIAVEAGQAKRVNDNSQLHQQNSFVQDLTVMPDMLESPSRKRAPHEQSTERVVCAAGTNHASVRRSLW
jgi:hypothetical protein